MAIGYHLGTADKANLVVGKLKDSKGIDSWEGIYGVFEWVVRDVGRQSRQGKAVIVLSGGKNSVGPCLCTLNLIHNRVDRQ